MPISNFEKARGSTSVEKLDPAGSSVLLFLVSDQLANNHLLNGQNLLSVTKVFC